MNSSASRVRILQPGVDIDDWPEQKFAHAVDLLREFRRDVAAWNARVGPTVSPVQVAPNRIEYRLSLPEEPPVPRWSLLLGDLLHALRAALDTVTWQLVNLDGGIPKYPRRVYFPIASNAADWDRKWVPVLDSMPLEFLERLHEMQTFAAKGAMISDPIRDLDRLDINDKHRGLLRAVPALDSIEYETSLDLFGPDGGPATGNGKITPADTNLPVVDGRLVATLDLFDGITCTLLPSPASAAPIVPGLIMEPSSLSALQVAGVLTTSIRMTLDTIYVGRDEAASRQLAAGTAELVDGSNARPGHRRMTLLEYPT